MPRDVHKGVCNKTHTDNELKCCSLCGAVITYSLTELIPSWGAASCAATQELLRSLWSPKVQNRVHNGPPLVSILRHITQSIPSHYISLRSILLLPTHLRLGLPSGLIPVLHSCYMPRPAHPSWLDHCNYTWRRVKVMKLMQLSPTSSCHFIPLLVSIIAIVKL
jgi:hypothetical protein